MTDFALKPHPAISAYDLSLISRDTTTTWQQQFDHQAGDQAGLPLAEWALLHNTDLQLDHTLKTAVLLSIFADRRWTKDAPIPLSHPHEDPRGWSGETTAYTHDHRQNHPWGSWLWLFRRAKYSHDTDGNHQIVIGQTRLPIRYLQDHLNQSLNWLIKTHIAAKTAVTAHPTHNNTRLNLHIQIWRPTNTPNLPALDSTWSLTLQDHLNDQQHGAPT